MNKLQKEIYNLEELIRNRWDDLSKIIKDGFSEINMRLSSDVIKEIERYVVLIKENNKELKQKDKIILIVNNIIDRYIEDKINKTDMKCFNEVKKELKEILNKEFK